MTESFSKNFIDYEEYPQSADIQNRCVSMIGRLFNAPVGLESGVGAVGTSCIGSSEAIMLGVLAMKKRWQNQRRAAGKSTDSPNLIMSSAVQVCWEKATRYFEIEEKLVYCSEDRYVIDPEQTVALVDENTIGICAILGTTYTGEYEDIKAVNDLLCKKGLTTPIHVDAASGGFVAPFVVPSLEWDFRLERVVSINVSGHKYGLVYPGVGWVVWRSAEYLPKELVRTPPYPCRLCRWGALTSCRFSTSTTSAPIRRPSHSTSARVHRRSSGSTTSSSAWARRATGPSCRI